MAGWLEKSAGIPVIEVGVPTKKDRGDLYAKSLQELDEQGLTPDQKINPNPKKEISPQLRKEINSNLSAAEKQSLEYLRLKALNVQTAIEKAKGPHNAERGVFVIEKKWENKFSLTSFGQTTEFHYIKKGENERFYLTVQSHNDNRIMTMYNAEEMIRLVNFINFSKDFIKDNLHANAPLFGKWKDVPFHENNGDILYGIALKILKSEHNFFPKSTKMIVDYLNSLYKEEIANQKIVQPKDADWFTPFPPK